MHSRINVEMVHVVNGSAAARRAYSSRSGEASTTPDMHATIQQHLEALSTSSQAVDAGATLPTWQEQRLAVLHSAADALQTLHDISGLPWWASIPLATLIVRSLLLPFSMFQARTVSVSHCQACSMASLTNLCAPVCKGACLW
jgi:membrane protein insertase Oxa1/YidC/SpoIIIJ